MPLLSQCFEGNGFPCGFLETVAAAYRDKDTDSRLAGSINVLTSQLNEYNSINSIHMKDGKVYWQDDDTYHDFQSLWNLQDEGYGEPVDNDGDGIEAEPTNNFLVYCCFSKQFNEEVGTNDEVGELGSGSMILGSGLAAVATTAAMMFIYRDRSFLENVHLLKINYYLLLLEYAILFLVSAEKWLPSLP